MRPMLCPLCRGSVQQEESLNVCFGTEAAIGRCSLWIDRVVTFFPHSNGVLSQPVRWVTTFIV